MNENQAITCVTNRMHDFRSCTYRGSHTAECDGFEYSWSEKLGRDAATGRECKGCRPRRARHGLLCDVCWEHVVQALADWPDFADKIRGVERAVQRDNGGIRGQSIGYVNLPGTLLAVNEIWSYQKSMHGTAELWVSSEAGAQDARRFARAVGTAQRTHAVEEKAHGVKRTRCPHCRQLTLVWNPTQYLGGDVTVTCSNPKCKAKLAQESFEKIALIENPGMEGTVLLDAGQGLTAKGEFAEPFNPDRPEHAELDPLTAVLVKDLRAMAEIFDIPRIKQLRKPELIDAIRDAQNPLEKTA